VCGDLLVVSGGADNDSPPYLHMVQLSTRSVTKSIPLDGHAGIGAHSFAVANHRAALAVVQAGRIELRELPSGRLYASCPASASTACFAPGDDRLLAACESGRIAVCDASTGALVSHFGEHLGDVSRITFSPAGTRLFAVARKSSSQNPDATSKALTLWDWPSQNLRTEASVAASAASAAFSTDGRYLAWQSPSSGGGEASLNVFDSESGKSHT